MKSVAEQQKAVDDLEPKVERLKSLYQQYFMGIEKMPPAILKRDVERAIYNLRKVRIQNTATRFKFQSVIQRLNTYQQYWQRIMRQIENGTYKRDLQRAADRFGDDAVAGRAVADEPSVPVWEISLDELEEDDDSRGGNVQGVWTVPQEALAQNLPDPTGGADAAALAQYEREQREYERKLREHQEKVRIYEEKKRAYEAYQRQQAALAHQAQLAALEQQRLAQQAQQATPNVIPAPRPQRPLPAPPPQHAPLPRASNPGQAPPAAPSAPIRPAPEPAPQKPAVRARRSRGGALPGTRRVPDDQQTRAIYNQYVQARREAGESTASITYEKLSKSLDTQRQNLKRKHGDRNVDFEVVSKNGRTMIRPVIK